MDRGHEFTVNVRGDGSYVVKLLEGVRIEQADGTTTGRWDAFGLTADGDSDAEVCQKLLVALQQQIAGNPDAPEYATFAAYVREHGLRLSDEEAAAREVARVREIPMRWHITDDEQYTVQLFREVDIERTADAVTARAFGLEGNGATIGAALQALKDAIGDACGTQETPGPRFDEFTDWARGTGEAVAAEILAQEARDKQAYLVARDKLTAITPDDIAAESSTGVPLLVDFWAEWCGPCRMVTPVLAALAEQWAGRIVIRKVDVDQFDGVWERFGFRGIPAMLIFKDGREIHRVLGFGGKADLVAELEPHLA